MITLETVLKDFTGFIDFITYELSVGGLFDDITSALLENTLEDDSKPEYHPFVDGYPEFETTKHVKLPEENTYQYLTLVQLIVDYINDNNIDYSTPYRFTDEEYRGWWNQHDEGMPAVEVYE